MAILPSESTGKNLNIYVFDGDKVNKYVVPFVDKGCQRRTMMIL